MLMRISECYGEGGDVVRKDESCADVVEIMVYVDEVEVDWFVIVEAGVLLLDSIPLILEDPFPLEGAGLDFLDPHGVLPKRPLFGVAEPLIVRLATLPNLLPSGPFSPLLAGSKGLGRTGGHGPRGFRGNVARNLPT